VVNGFPARGPARHGCCGCGISASTGHGRRCPGVVSDKINYNKIKYLQQISGNFRNFLPESKGVPGAPTILVMTRRRGDRG
jgi:hypothetical protein